MKRFFVFLSTILLWANVGWGNDKTVVIGDTAFFTFTYTSAIDSAQLILIRGAVADTFSLMPIAGSSHKGCDWEGLFNQVDSAGSYLVWIEPYSGGAIIDTVLGSCYVELAVREANMVQMADNVITAPKIADDAIDYATFAATAPTAWWNEGKTGYGLSATQTFDLTGDITGNLSGSVGSVTGAVGSVTGAVGSVTGNVGGSVASVVAEVSADMVKISGDGTAADNFETMLDGTGGQILSLRGLHVRGTAGNDTAGIFTGYGIGHGFVSSAPGIGYGAVIYSAFGDAFKVSGANKGLYITGGQRGLVAEGTADAGLFITGQTEGIYVQGNTGVGLEIRGLANDGMKVVGTGAGKYDINADIHGSIDTVLKPVSATAEIDSEEIARAVWDDDVVAQANRTVTASCAGSGTDTLDLYIFDADTTAVEGVIITVWNKGRTATVVPGINTDVNGKVQLGLSADTFHVWLHRLGVIYSEWDTVVVPSGGGIDTIWVTAYSPGSPPSPSLTRVQGYNTDVGGRNDDQLTVIFTPQYSNLIDTSLGVFIDTKDYKAYSDTGFFFADLTPSGNMISKEADVTIDSVRYDLTIRRGYLIIFERTGIYVPTDTTVWLKDILDD